MHHPKVPIERQLTRKPSLNRKPPVVKQTKGSLLRMIKANPLIALDEVTKQQLGITDAELKQLGHIGVVQKVMSLAENNPTECKAEPLGNDYLKKDPKPKVSTKCDTGKILNNRQPKEFNEPKEKPKPNTNRAKPKISSNNCRSNLTFKQNAWSRRSASAEKFDSKKYFLNILPQDNTQYQSMEDLPRASQLETPLKRKPISFRTPQTYRNVFNIPSTTKRFNRNDYNCSTPAEVKIKLNSWLSKRGKSIGSYHHLRCFGIPQEDDEDKENIEQVGLVRSESYESLGIIPEGQESKEDSTNSTIQPKAIINYDGIARDALQDLITLIQEGYPSDRCGDWLNMIKEKCHNIEDEPTYWECRAALEECFENIPNAIICYRTAIIKGAELKTVDESLDHLLEKFSLLNIDSHIEAKDPMKNAKIILDARNVFKSTIIQFAVHERDNKKKEDPSHKQTFVTPVRRSSRLSLHQKLTPGVKLFSSLREVDKGQNADFKTNKFLGVRYN